MRKIILPVVLASVLAGCGTAVNDAYIPVTQAVPPRASGPSAAISQALACIRRSNALRGTRIAIAIHADGTGKINAIAEGSTGNFLPQGTTAVFASQAVLLAGAQPHNYYELNTERAMRGFASGDAQKLLADQQDAALPSYVISTSFTALDFIGGPEVDVRVAGIGPRYVRRGAALEAVAEVYQPGNRRIIRMSSVQRYVDFREIGLGVSKFVGDGAGTLVTGAAQYTDQQRLQEATRDVVALTVADVLSQFPGVPSRCRKEVLALLAGEQPERSAVAISSKN